MNGNRDADPHMAESPASIDDNQLAAFVDHVETCLQRRETLHTVLSEIHADHLRGESVQDDLNDLFASEPAVFNLALIAANDDLADFLEMAADAESLSAAQIEAFRELWTTHSWITEGALAFLREQEYGTTYWTSKRLDLQARDGQIFIQHAFNWGLDDVHEIEAPLTDTWGELIGRALAILTRVSDPRIKLSEEEIVALKESQEALEQMLDIISGVQGGGDELPNAESLQELFKTREADRRIDGSDGEDEDEGSTVDDDDSLIGFA